MDNIRKGKNRVMESRFGKMEVSTRVSLKEISAMGRVDSSTLRVMLIRVTGWKTRPVAKGTFCTVMGQCKLLFYQKC